MRIVISGYSTMPHRKLRTALEGLFWAYLTIAILVNRFLSNVSRIDIFQLHDMYRTAMFMVYRILFNFYKFSRPISKRKSTVAGRVIYKLYDSFIIFY